MIPLLFEILPNVCIEWNKHSLFSLSHSQNQASQDKGNRSATGLWTFPVSTSVNFILYHQANRGMPFYDQFRGLESKPRSRLRHDLRSQFGVLTPAWMIHCCACPWHLRTGQRKDPHHPEASIVGSLGCARKYHKHWHISRKFWKNWWMYRTFSSLWAHRLLGHHTPLIQPKLDWDCSWPQTTTLFSNNSQSSDSPKFSIFQEDPWFNHRIISTVILTLGKNILRAKQFGAKLSELAR